MATKKPTKKTAHRTDTHKVRTVQEERHVKGEIKEKFDRLDAKAKAEVVNEVVAKQFNGFVDFLREQSVVGLAIGLVLGTQVKQLVDSIVNNFMNPLIGLVLPGNSDLAKKAVTVHFNGKAAVFGWGSFLSTFISFVTVAAIVYFVFRALKLDKLAKKK